MANVFKKKAKVAKDEPNPWLNIEHPHNWLPANDGKEYVCGDCGFRIESGAPKPEVHVPVKKK